VEKIFRHVLLPLLAPLLIVCLYFTPKQVFGCMNRGLLALAVAVIALAAAIFTTGKAIREKRNGNAETANWWIVSTLILLTALFLLVGPLA
jgi:hypothetical protein